MSAVIRPAVVTDADAIAGVHVRTWQAAYRGQLPDEFLTQLDRDLPRRAEFRCARLAGADARTRVFVADSDGAVVGFASVGPARDQADASLGESLRGRAVRTAAFTSEVVAGADHLYAGREPEVAARIASWMRGL